MIEIKQGDFVYSKYFKSWLEIVVINSDDDWLFKYQGHTLKAKSPLSSFTKVKPKKEGI